ncbi:flagellar hook-associated protein FlgL [Bacillus sp. JJ1566]|uniref:flagellar hook-associated protein FlgL n=1 Tax=Bacillus sp. JJ1566 TaxID=3122961 RepID=UPI002FFE6DCC
MRVTQSMLSNNMLRHLSGSYSKMGKIQEQLMTGKKINRPSDDPVVAMKGIAYRTNLDKVQQFQRNMGEVHNWLDTTDETLNQVTSAMHRVSELLVQASTDTLTPNDREKIAVEMEQIQKQIVDFANTKLGDKYLFSGTNTLQPLFTGYPTTGNLNVNPNANSNKVEIEVFNGITLDVNVDGKTFFANSTNGVVAKLGEIVGTLKDPAKSGADLTGYLSDIETQMDNLLLLRAEIGAKQNRAEMMEYRLDSQEITATKLMSENEDADIEKIITELTTQESLHRAALSVGARIIQPSLIDFLR